MSDSHQHAADHAHAATPAGPVYANSRTGWWWFIAMLGVAFAFWGVATGAGRKFNYGISADPRGTAPLPISNGPDVLTPSTATEHASVAK